MTGIQETDPENILAPTNSW